MPSSFHPLPSPANDMQADAINALNDASRSIQALIRFHRGHQKSAQSLERIATQILSMTMTLDRLPWPSTECEPPFKNPPATREPLTDSEIEDLRHG